MPNQKINRGDVVVRPQPTPGPLENPLKGWCPYIDAGQIHQPYSLIYQYVSWRELEPMPGQYAFSQWEQRSWDKEAARGKQIIFRVYVDYPGKPTGLPQWLLDQGVRTTRYTDYGGGHSPNYDDPKLLQAMERLLAALGHRYDNHPRVAFVQMGLLGFWGEWHTYPRTELFASPATEQRVLEAAHRAFSRTLLMTRYPARFAGQQPWLGFFDDLFPEDTDGSEAWKFLPTMRRAGRTNNWKCAPVGGEMVPGDAIKRLGSDFAQTMARLEAAHFSWVGPYSPPLEKTADPAFLIRSQQMVRRMGYSFCLTQIRHSQKAEAGHSLRFHITGENTGIAPFYYPWPLEVALFEAPTVGNRSPRPVALRRLPTDIRTWLPGFLVTDVLPLPKKPGKYTLALRIVNPYDGGPPLRFANDLPRYQDWTLLSPVTVVGRTG